MMRCLLSVPRNRAAALLVALLASANYASAQTAAADELFDCLIEPGLLVRLESQVDGALREVGVDRGSLVRAGDVIARVDSGFEEATVDLLRVRADDASSIEARLAQKEFANVRLERANQLLEREAIPRGQVEELEAAFKISEAELAAARKAQEIAVMELRRAEADLHRYRITSPIDGVVTQRFLSPGESVYQDREIAEVASLDPLHVEVFLPVAMFPGLQVGQTGSVMPGLPGATPRTATVDVIDSVLDPTSNTFGVRLSLANEDLALPAGLRCQLSFLQ